MFCISTSLFPMNSFAMQSQESLVLEETGVKPSASLALLFNPVKRYIS